MNAYGSLAGFYDALTRDVPYGALADWYDGALGAQPGEFRLILDLCCGTGTLACLMAERGYEVIAADSSPDMLMAAAEKAAGCRADTPPVFICQSAAGLDLYGTVDAAYSSLDSINYIPPDELAEAFRRLALFIRPGGVLIFDIRTPEFLRSMDGSMSVDETDDLLCLWRGSFSETQNALVYGMDIFSRRGDVWDREREEHAEYAHDPEWLFEQLTASGFTGPALRADAPMAGDGRIFIFTTRG